MFPTPYFIFIDQEKKITSLSIKFTSFVRKHKTLKLAIFYIFRAIHLAIISVPYWLLLDSKDLCLSQQ